MTFTHGQRNTSIYNVWRNMRQRCFNPNHPRYADYGGRGITVCDRWRDSFETFHADVGDLPEGMTLDRIDNDGNYEPGNVRWATRADQNRNQRPRQPKTCTVPGCSSKHEAHGLCHTHYYRQYRAQRAEKQGA